MASKPPTADALIALRDLPPEAMVTAPQAAAILAVSENVLGRMRRDGIGPAYAKDGGIDRAVRYRKKDLEAWLAAVKTGGKIR